MAKVAKSIPSIKVQMNAPLLTNQPTFLSAYMDCQKIVKVYLNAKRHTSTSIFQTIMRWLPLLSISHKNRCYNKLSVPSQHQCYHIFKRGFSLRDFEFIQLFPTPSSFIPCSAASILKLEAGVGSRLAVSLCTAASNNIIITLTILSYLVNP